MNKKVLVVGAHPDDEVLGCGGTIAKYIQQNDEVFCLILGEGITSRYGRVKGLQKALKELKLEAMHASEILGVKTVIFKDFRDNCFDTIPLLTLIKAVEEIKEEIKPDIIYTHHQGDLNIDHQLTLRAVLTACRSLSGETVREIYSFEAASSTEWSSPHAQNVFIPNVFVDISETFEKKIEALKAYKNEMREYPHPRSPEALCAIGMRWGSIVGCEKAEAFELIRIIK